jgi:hypothetical protein
MTTKQLRQKNFRRGLTEEQVRSALRTIAMNRDLQQRLERHLPTRVYLIRIARRLLA